MADEVIYNNKICSNEIFSIEKKIYILIIKKIIRSFLNNIYDSTDDEIYKIKKKDESFFKIKIFVKLTSILIFFQKFKLENLFKLKTKRYFLFR